MSAFASARVALAPVMAPVAGRLVAAAQRYDQLSLRERGMIFGSALLLVLVSWQLLVMDPLDTRAAAAETRLAEASRRAEAAGEIDAALAGNPAMAAAARGQALRQQRARLDTALAGAARGYVAPDQMAAVVRALLVRQQSLRLLGLRNLPPESLGSGGSAPVEATVAGQPSAPAGGDRGPWLHPIEIELEGDYASLVDYLVALERLPWRLRWREVAVTARDYPVNRIRIEIATLSLSREWMSV
jgi:MSHA biogenesis protein MshJ